MRASAVLLTPASRVLGLGVLALALAAGSVGCAPTGQGDPCIPEAIPTGGFSDMEVYVETSSVQCRTRVCMVYRLNGNPECPAGSDACATSAACHTTTMPPVPLCLAPEVPGMISTQGNSPDRVFCTCRCSAGGNASLPLCHCLDGFRCIPDADPGGGYCVPNELAIAAGVCNGSGECPNNGTCDMNTHHCH